MLFVLLAGCADPCSEQVSFSGGCERLVEGYRYDAASGSCVAARGSCNVEGPFMSEIECLAVCAE